MGTWGSGLWDNDSSLDALPELVHLPAGKDLVRTLVAWGVRLWFAQCTPAEFSKGLERRSKELIKLPKPLFDELVAIAQRPKEFEQKESRRPEHREVIGGYCDGYRVEPIFSLPGARDVVAELAERNAARLDKAFGRKKQVSLYEDQLTELGVLLELTNVGVFQRPERVEAWRAGFAAMNAATPEERGFWDEYCGRVEKVFMLLVRPAK